MTTTKIVVAGVVGLLALKALAPKAAPAAPTAGGRQSIDQGVIAGGIPPWQIAGGAGQRPVLGDLTWMQFAAVPAELRPSGCG